MNSIFPTVPLTAASEDDAAVRSILVTDDVTVCLLQVIRMMVSHPADVCAEILPEADRSILRVLVNQQDLGFVIGRKGRTARSLRVLLAALACRQGLRVTLDLDVLVLSDPVLLAKQ